MTNIVFMGDAGLPVTTSLVISEGAEVQHKNVLELIRKNLGDLQQFGPIAFETRKGSALPQGGFARSTEVAILNEQQATLVFTYMRNTAPVKKFKIALVKAFFEMAKKLREQPQAPQIPFNIPKTLPDALRLAADLADKNAALEAQIEADKPKVEFFSRIVQSDTEFCISDVAKMLGYGVQKFFIYLRQKAWMWQHEYRARSEVCTEGYMAMRVTEKNGKQYSQPVFLGKGIFKIYRMMLKDGLIERNPQIEMSMK